MVQNMRFRLNNHSECNDDFITGNLNHKYLTYDSLVGLESMETDSKPTKLKPDDVYDLFGIKRPSEGLRYGIQVAYQFGLSAILLVIKRDEVNKISSEAVKVRTISEWVNFYQKIFKVREALLFAYALLQWLEDAIGEYSTIAYLLSDGTPVASTY